MLWRSVLCHLMAGRMGFWQVVTSSKKHVTTNYNSICVNHIALNTACFNLPLTGTTSLVSSAFSGGMKTSGFPRIPPVALPHPVSQVEDRALGQGLFIAVEKFQAQRLFGGS